MRTSPASAGRTTRSTRCFSPQVTPTTPPSLGMNSKVNQLCRLVQEARYDLLAISDSDVRVEPDSLRQVAAPFRDPQVGAVTALFRADVKGGLLAHLDALGAAEDF